MDESRAVVHGPSAAIQSLSLNYLLVGLGNIGRKRQEVLGEHCVATVDPYNAAAEFASPDGCDPDRYQAAILSVPNEVKLELLHYFLSRGKHVLVEKPLLFPDRPSAEKLQRMAEDHRAVWYTSYNHRFEHLVAALKERLDEGRIGQIYSARLFYGNGTVGNVIGTFREQGLGVVEDLGSHLVDLSGHLLGYAGAEFSAWSLQRHESKGLDRAILGSTDGRVVLEMSFLSWKNTFTIDVIGQRGSLHLSGLRKWGPSELLLRERVFPSGVPHETCETSEGPDVTWRLDTEHFERQVAGGQTSMENDWWISRTLLAVAGET